MSAACILSFAVFIYQTVKVVDRRTILAPDADLDGQYVRSHGLAEFPPKHTSAWMAGKYRAFVPQQNSSCCGCELEGLDVHDAGFTGNMWCSQGAALTETCSTPLYKRAWQSQGSRAGVQAWGDEDSPTAN